MRDPILVCSIATLIACGSSNNTTVDSATHHDSSIDGAGSNNANEVNGQVEGQSFAAKDAVWNQFSHTNGFGFVGNSGFVEMTDYAGACALAAQDMAPTSSRIILFGVGVIDASSMSSLPTTAGTFTVYDSDNPLPASVNAAQVYFSSGCSKDIAYEGISGTVTIATVHQDGSYVGTFDVVVSCKAFGTCNGPDAHLTGKFSSTSCVSLNVNTIPACS